MDKITIIPVIDSFHQTWGFKLRNIDPVQAEIISSIIRANHLNSLDYIEKQKVNAFLQGYSYDNPGDWVYIELWCKDMDRIKRFCTYVEEQVNDPERYNRQKEFMSWETK